MRLTTMLPNSVVDAYIRRKAQLEKTPLDVYTVKVATTLEEYEDAFRLLHIAYAFQGIESVRTSGLRITAQHVLPESTVLVAYEGDLIVGTMTVTLDSPAGLPLENDYPDEIAALRAQGARLIEYGSLAVVRRCWNTGVTTLMNIAATQFQRRILQGTHIIAGVNPKAMAMYRALFNFSVLGDTRGHTHLEAPVQGMVQETASLPGHLDRYYHKRLCDGRLPSDHFLDTPSVCIKIPPVSDLRELIKLKLPRKLFQDLFIEKTDHIYSLDPCTWEYLNKQRSQETLADVRLSQMINLDEIRAQVKLDQASNGD